MAQAVTDVGKRKQNPTPVKNHRFLTPSPRGEGLGERSEAFGTVNDICIKSRIPNLLQMPGFFVKI